MNGEKQFSISGVVDNLPVSRTTFMVVGLCFAAMLCEGYNLGVPGFAAPGVIGEFGITRAAMAPVFSAALFGMLIGALVTGFVGDRTGRKSGILLSIIVICAASFGCGAAQNLTQLLWLRFVVGLGLGGLLPNGTALLTEFIPKRVRGSLTTYAMMGIIAGGFLAGMVGAQFEPRDWRLLFLVGGFFPLAILPLLFLLLPESLKFLTLRPKRQGELRKWLAVLSPAAIVPAGMHFVLDERGGDFTLASLFAGRLAWITPALWLSYIFIMLVNFFINSWLILMLSDIGFTARQAAATASLYYAGGLCGAIVIGAALDRAGPAVLVLYCGLGCAVMALIGIPTSAAFTYLLVGLIGFSVLGTQVGFSGIIGMLYPTAMRSKGVGFCHSVGRLGAVAGPLLAGLLMSKNSSFLVLFLTPALPLALVVPCVLVITRLWTGRLAGRGLCGVADMVD